MVATVTSKGQVTLPAEVRRRLSIHAGSKLEFVIRGSNRLEVICLDGSIKDLKGLLPRPERTLSLNEMDIAIAESVAE